MDKASVPVKYKEFHRVYPNEWIYFKEYARRFDLNPPEKRYGVLPMNAEPGWDSMIYAEDPLKLRLKHVDWLLQHSDKLRNSIGGLRQFLTWLEKVEGKS